MTTTQYNILLESGIKQRAIETLEAAFQSKEIALSKEDLHNTELRLLKEIESIKKEVQIIKNEAIQNKAELQIEIQKNKAELQIEIEKIRKETIEIKAELQKEIQESKAELQREIKELDIKIEKSKSETIKWVVGVGIAILLPVMSMLTFIFFKL